MRHDYTARAHTRTCTLIKLTCLRAYPPSFIAKSSPLSPFSIWADKKLSLRGRRTANCHGTRDAGRGTWQGLRQMDPILAAKKKRHQLPHSHCCPLAENCCASTTLSVQLLTSLSNCKQKPAYKGVSSGTVAGSVDSTITSIRDY